MRLWNDRKTALSEAMDGILMANPDKYERLSTVYGYGLYRRHLPEKRVRIILSGGGGYGPMWSGFAEDGLADAVVHGNFDCAPNAYALYEMAKTVDAGQGILFLTNNYMGDYLNNDMAVELLRHEGIQAELCCISDDILSSMGESATDRGGLHGIGQVCKICAGAAKDGYPLHELWGLANKTKGRMRSLSANLRENQLFLGEGFSGEPAVMIRDFESVDQLLELAVDILLSELQQFTNDSVYISVNSNAKVSFTEGMSLLEQTGKALERRGVQLCGGAVGTYFDVFSGDGCMLNVTFCDQEMVRYVAPVHGYCFTI